jgi:hypothetical protein
MVLEPIQLVQLDLIVVEFFVSSFPQHLHDHLHYSFLVLLFVMVVEF